MSNQYVIQKETLDSIAAQSMNLIGKTEAVYPSEIISDLTNVNTEVGTQADLIAQIQTVIDSKVNGDSPSITEPVLQIKTITPTKEQQEIVADDGYDGLEKVVIEGDNELNSENIKKGVNIFGIDGSYEVQQVTPTISVNSTGLITATAGDKSATKQLTIQTAKTVTPSTSSQTAVASGRYTTGAVTVAAVPTQTKSVTPSTSTLTVAPDSGKFLSSVNVVGDANLKSDNIKSGVSIFGVNGSLNASAQYHVGKPTNATPVSISITKGSEYTIAITIQNYPYSNITWISNVLSILDADENYVINVFGFLDSNNTSTSGYCQLVKDYSVFNGDCYYTLENNTVTVYLTDINTRIGNLTVNGDSIYMNTYYGYCV